MCLRVLHFADRRCSGPQFDASTYRWTVSRLGEVCAYATPAASAHVVTHLWLSASVKLLFVRQLLAQLSAANHRVLIFSSSTKMLDMLHKVRIGSTEAADCHTAAATQIITML